MKIFPNSGKKKLWMYEKYTMEIITCGKKKVIKSENYNLSYFNHS